MKGKKVKRIAGIDGRVLSVEPILRVVNQNLAGNRIAHTEENRHEEPKNIGIIFPSGKKVKLTNFPFRTETAYLEIKNKFPITVWQELNELHAKYISQLAEYKLEEVRDFIQSKGKGKLVAYRKENLTKEEKE